jgi:nucleoside-diphosphate-sugar epimerase
MQQPEEGRMQVTVIGGTGHIGSYLVPRLVEAGHCVRVVSRGERSPYVPHDAWSHAEFLRLDRGAEESAGRFGEQIAAARPDVVIDLTCYTLESAVQLAESLRGRVGHFLHCGTIWVHGPAVELPTTEEAPRRPFGDYGCRKAAIEAYLLDEARRRGFPATVLHPGHLVGAGWNPLNPAANFNPEVFSRLARGEELLLPNLGMETVHHVHCDDVAQAFLCAITHRDAALGESFHVVSPGALTLRGYAESMAACFGREPQLRFLPFEEWRRHFSHKEAETTWNHIARSSHCSIEKARRVLGYAPRYSSLDAVRESVGWLIENGILRRSDN